MSALPRQLYGHLLSRWESLRESYWFLPMLMALGGAALALALIEVDHRFAGSWSRRLPWIHDTGADGTRAVLAAVVGSMITVTGVVFSIMIVALTLASSQFGPRLLRNFLRDRGNQLVFGTFVATFLYGLLVLRAVSDDEVPYFAATGAIVLAVVSLFVLIYFVHHAASSIQASSVIAAVSREIDVQLPVLFPEGLGEAPPPALDARDRSRLASLESDGVDVAATYSGYVRVLDPSALLEVARRVDGLVAVRLRPGDFATAGAVLARVGSAAPVDDELIASLRECFVLGDRRTAVQDLAFLIDQLVEMAVRALSPGVNDPGTACACVHRLGAVLAHVAERPMPSAHRFDGDGWLRVVVPPTSFESIAARCLDPIRRHGAGHPEVVTAALRAIEEGVRRAARDRQAVLAEHAREIRDAFEAAAPPSARDRTAVADATDRILRRLVAGDVA